MANGKMSYTNLITDGTITVSSEATGFEKSFLTDNNQGNVWRSTAITSTTITIDMGGTTAIKGVVGLNTNMVASDTTFKFEASTDNFSTTSETADITFDGVNMIHEADWSYRYYRFRLVKDTGSYIELGEIYLMGTLYEFPTNFTWNYRKNNNRIFNTTKTDGGQIFRSLEYSNVGFETKFQAITTTQKDIFETISASPYVIFFPTGTSGPVYYGVVDFNNYVNSRGIYWNVNMAFEESPA